MVCCFMGNAAAGPSWGFEGVVDPQSHKALVGKT